MNVLVCGGRDYRDWECVKRTLDEIRPTKVIHGAAPGADSLAGLWARTNGVPEDAYPADWGKDGRAAGPLRNARMLREGCPDLVVAFPGGRGTGDMVARATRAGVPVRAIGG